MDGKSKFLNGHQWFQILLMLNQFSYIYSLSIIELDLWEIYKGQENINIKEWSLIKILINFFLLIIGSKLFN